MNVSQIELPQPYKIWLLPNEMRPSFLRKMHRTLAKRYRPHIHGHLIRIQLLFLFVSNWIWIGETLTYRGYLIFNRINAANFRFHLICLAKHQSFGSRFIFACAGVPVAFCAHRTLKRYVVGKIVRIKSCYVTIDHIKWEKFDQLTVLSNDKSSGISSVAFKLNENQLAGDRDEGNNIIDIFLFLFQFFFLLFIDGLGTI